MGLKGLFKGLFSANRNNNNIINIFLKDKKCGHKIKVVLRKSYDIQRVYNDQDQETAFMINKLIVCDKCFNKINIDIKFDKRYNILSRKIDQGEFITEEEYNKH